MIRKLQHSQQLNRPLQENTVGRSFVSRGVFLRKEVIIIDLHKSLNFI